MVTRGPSRKRRRARPSRPSPAATSRSLLLAIKRETRELTEEMPFSEYLNKVLAEGRPTRLSHQLIHDAILAGGVSIGPDGEPRYGLFRDEVFGADDVLRQVVEYFAAAARRLDVRRRILLLVGPPGCGKSTIVNAIKSGLEDYTRTPEGAVYAIKDCPVHEDPLHLIPRHHREEVADLHIEGDLCPYCQWQLAELYRGDVGRVPVARVTFSVTGGVGIGTFVATDPRSEDLTRLVGKVDTSLLRGNSKQAAKRAFRLDGELCAANRGLADLIEIFKMDERFLAVLLTLSQEHFIKISGPMTMYADEAIVAHSNLAEYESLVEDPHSAALQDRLVAVRVRYVLSVRDEIRIYEKLLGEAGAQDATVSPLALPAAATLAVLTRLEEPRRSGYDLRKKLHLYDGRFVPDARPEDLAELRAEAPGEGLTGISPRYVLNQLSNVLSRGEACVSGDALLGALWEGLTQRASFREEERDRWTTLFSIAREEYEDMVKRTIRRAMVPGYWDTAEARAQDALRNLRRWKKGADEWDLAAMRRIERALGVPHHRRGDFRDGLLAALEEAEEREEDLILADPRLEEALERDLLPDWRQAARKLSDLESGGRAATRERERLQERLMEEEGFSEPCAEDLLAEATRLAASGGEGGGRGWSFWRS